MSADMRVVQLARMLAVPLDSLTLATAASLIERQPGALAEALFREAADSDDVTGIEAALDYLAARLEWFGDLAGPAARTAITRAFRDRLRAWE